MAGHGPQPKDSEHRRRRIADPVLETDWAFVLGTAILHHRLWEDRERRRR
jgi:hypothetical protein